MDAKMIVDPRAKLLTSPQYQLFSLSLKRFDTEASFSGEGLSDPPGFSRLGSFLERLILSNVS